MLAHLASVAADPAGSSGRLVAPALGGAPVSSPDPAAPAPGVADSSPPVDSVVGSDGLIICSHKRIPVRAWPLSRQLAIRGFAAMPTASADLKQLLVENSLKGPIFTFRTDIESELKNGGGLSIAFYDRHISSLDNAAFAEPG